MEKKALLTASFISVLLFSAVAGAQLVNLGRANPYAIRMVEEGEVSPPEGALLPAILILSPENSTAYASNTVSLTLNVSEPWPEYVIEIYYRASWKRLEKTPVRFVRLKSCLYALPQISINVTDVPEGSRWLEVYAVSQGKIKTREEYRYPFLTEYYVTYKVTCSSMVNFTIDTTPPKVSISSLENKTYSTATIPLNFMTNERISQSTYSLDGQENVTITGNTTLTGLAIGDHNLTVYAKDEAGNVGASRTIWFSVAEPFPTTLVVAASVAIVAVVGAVLLVYFKKRKR